MARLSISAVAKKLGLSERRLYKILREKTASRSRAEQLALYRGGDAEDYLRAARPRGRPKRDSEYIFRTFISELTGGREEGHSDEYITLIQEFQRSYPVGRRGLVTPDDFETLEHLLGFIRNADFYLECRDEALNLWKQFKIWRIRQECAERIFAVEMGDDVS